MDEYTALQNSFSEIQSQLSTTVVGQEVVVEQLMIALLAGGHCLFEGAPGAARALTVAKLSTALGLSFSRICCSPELQPEELVGACDLADDGRAETVPGPLFAHVIFLDDAPRLAPKTAAVVQQALLGKEVIVHSRRYTLADPHVVLAATYSDAELPVSVEPRDDRYMMKIAIPFPSYQDEYRIAESTSGPLRSEVNRVLEAEQLLDLRRQVREVMVPPHVIHYSLRLVRATRVHEGETPDFIYEWVQSGAGTRAAHALVLAAKIRAALYGRNAAGSDDVHAVAAPVLRHRVVPNQNARSNGVTVDRVVSRLLYEIPARTAGDDQAPDVS